MDNSVVITIGNEKSESEIEADEVVISQKLPEDEEEEEEDQDDGEDCNNEEEEEEEVDAKKDSLVAPSSNKKKSKKRQKKNNQNSANKGSENISVNSGRAPQNKKQQNDSCNYTTNKNNPKSDKGNSVFPNIGISNPGSNNQGNNNGNVLFNKEFLKGMKDLASNLSKKCNCPLDSWILFLYYRWGFILFYGIFLTVHLSWYIKEPIVCISGFDANKAFPHYLNICLSYPFTMDPATNKKRFILFYRWLHYSCLVIGFFFYLPRFFIKAFNDPKLHSVLDYLENNSKVYDDRGFLAKRDLVLLYVRDHLGTHKKQAFLYVLNHLLAICYGIMIVAFIDFQLQGWFLYLPHHTFPFNRDPEWFTDGLSQIFPPFVQCLVGTGADLSNERLEAYSCHLTLMEVYEKVFFFLWFFIFTLILLSLLYCLSLLAILLPPTKSMLLNTSYDPYEGEKVKRYLVKNLSIGDFFMLYRMKRYLSDKLFFIVQRDIMEILARRRSSQEEKEAALISVEDMHEHLSSTPVSKLVIGSNKTSNCFLRIRKSRKNDPIQQRSKDRLPDDIPIV